MEQAAPARASISSRVSVLGLGLGLGLELENVAQVRTKVGGYR